MDILKSYCKHLYCLLPPVEKGLCGYHLTDPPEDESHYSVYRITFPDGRAFIEATDTTVATRIKEHSRTPNSPIGQAIKPGSVWRGDCLGTGLSRRQALSLALKEKTRIDRQIKKRPVSRQSISNSSWCPSESRRDFWSRSTRPVLTRPIPVIRSFPKCLGNTSMGN